MLLIDLFMFHVESRHVCVCTGLLYLFCWYNHYIYDVMPIHVFLYVDAYIYIYEDIILCMHKVASKKYYTTMQDQRPYQQFDYFLARGLEVLGWRREGDTLDPHDHPWSSTTKGCPREPGLKWMQQSYWILPTSKVWFGLSPFPAIVEMKVYRNSLLKM